MFVRGLFSFFFVILGLTSSLAADDQSQDPLSHVVLVTVAPHRYLVNRIAGDTVKVEVIVPSTANVHTFEPTPKQMIRAAEADIWFRIGESFEKRLVESLQAHHPTLQVVDLRQGLDLIYGTHEHGPCCNHDEGVDLHFWLSPNQLKIQALTVTNNLVALYPEHETQYRAALKEHLRELDRLDNELRMELEFIRGRTILVVHPAYGYFCRDYHLKQLSIEIEGKDPSSKQLSQLLHQIKTHRLRTVFSQIQYSPKVADLVKEQLGPNGKVVELDPYAENYMKNMRFIARQFLQA